MLLLIVQDVFPEHVAFNDLDVRRKTYDEAAGAFKAVDCGLKEPFAVLPLQVFLCQGGIPPGGGSLPWC